MKCPIFNNKNTYVYQLQIRIFNFEPNSTELTDCLPYDFRILVNNKVCIIPSITENTQRKTEARQLAQPINNCIQFLTLNSSIANTIVINWITDGKTYVIGMYILKELTSKELLKKNYDKEPASLNDTKDSIMKYFANVDPDLAIILYPISLVCPLGKIRMNRPGKSTKCDHFQCFDVSTFILMNENTQLGFVGYVTNPTYTITYKKNHIFWKFSRVLTSLVTVKKLNY